MCADIAPHEALKTWNCGIGMILVVDPKRVDEVSDVLTKHGETVYPIGSISLKQDGKEPHVVVSNENILKV
jgi:phosphoribosylformylglycinamidine cyclo-ligase